MPAARTAPFIGGLLLLLAACGSGADPELLAAGDDVSVAGVTVVVGSDGGQVIDAGSDPDSGPGMETTVPAGDEAAEARTPLSIELGAPSSTTVAVEPVEAEAFPRSATADVPLVIFDTDMGPDIDDALALAMLHTYENRGMIELAAVTVSRNSEAGARYSDALNTFYGRPDIPIGINRHNPPYFDDRLIYVSLADRWPNDVAAAPIQDGVTLLRRVLADGLASGRPVILIQTGFSGNVSQLLDSPGDEISSLNGVELARQSVSVLSIMAGSIDLGIVEFNIEKEVGPARNVFGKWPGPLVMSPFELGNAIHYPYSSIRSDLNWTADHPVKAAYEFRDLDWHVDAPPFYNMRSWDLTSVIQAVEPKSEYFLVSAPGKVSVDASGRTTFRPGDGQHYVLDRARQYSGGQRQRVIDRMIELVSAQP